MSDRHFTIAGRRSPHLATRPAGVLAFEPAPDPGLTGALCAQVEPELFFPESGDKQTAELAREICVRCPVAAACLADALRAEEGQSHRSRFGIRGGTSPEQRSWLYLLSRQPEEAAVAARPPVVVPARPKREPVKCGTRRGYQRHRRNGEDACARCRSVNSAADRRLRSTGTTKEAA
ncbi:WhiB family transcriptional regulator [Streptomyces sp. NPDC051173]|uniref:WhiB family transcriptional regulator n=1 Tax=Streptomyces sp. NPDC051173 TaxID=3155164 RepID=UPI00344D3E57